MYCIVLYSSAAIHDGPVDLGDHLAYNLLAHIALHLDGSYELTGLDEVADVDARVVTDTPPDGARSVEEKRLQQQNQRRPLVVGDRSTTAVVQRLFLRTHTQTDRQTHQAWPWVQFS